MDDNAIHDHITRLVAREHALRERLAAGEIGADEERAELQRAEIELDRYWDLLRQRQARREFGENPDDAALRSEGTVEGYQG